MPKQVFNKQPYYDDFDSSKNFMRILFKPDRALQVRELNQIQSIFNNQIESFADHIFKFGSRVDAGSVKYEQDVHYVRLKDLDWLGNDVRIDYLLGKTLHGKNSEVVARVKHIETKTEDDPHTLYVNYTRAGKDGETFVFLDGEELNVLDDSGNIEYTVTVRCINCDTNSDEDQITPTGKGSLFQCSESTYYVYGYFVETQHQIVALSKYSQTATCSVGLIVDQKIITENDDETLFDNAYGQINYVSSGADRYQITLTLSVVGVDEPNSENFIKLGSITNGVLNEIANKPQYADIMKMIARRTYDESGDYTVTPFIVTPKEHLKESVTDTNGYLTAEQGGDESKIAAYLSEGKAYVKGYEIEKISTFVVPIDKARDTEKKESSVTRKDYGNYILIQLNDISNFIPGGTSLTGDGRKRNVFDFTELTLYDAPVNNLSTAGNPIGTVIAKGMALYEKDAVFTDSVWKLNLTNIAMEAGYKLSDAQGILATGMIGGTSFGANLVPDTYVFNDNSIRVFETGENSLIFPLPYSFVKSVRNIYNQTETRTNFHTPIKYYAQADSSGNAVFVVRGDETITTHNQATWFLGQYDGSSNFSPVELVSNDVSVTSTSITVSNLTAFQDYFIVAECIVTSRPEKTKTLTAQAQELDPTQRTNDLNWADVYSLNAVYLWDNVTYLSWEDALAAEDYQDITENYNLNLNINDNYYGISSISLIDSIDPAGYSGSIHVEYEYFLHGNTTDGTYFSVDSYLPTINDPNNTFTYEDIPSYQTIYGTSYNLTDCLDFRPVKLSNGSYVGTGYIPSENKNIFADVEYYLPRRDLLCIDDNGNFFQVKGKSSLKPKYPETPDNAMSIYTMDMKPYTFDPLTDAGFKYVDNKRYTMRDIGEFEGRIKNLQYYVSLNLLDQQLEAMQVTDADGNDRYKNGFLTDGFNDLRGGDTSSSEYRCAINPEKGNLRPQFNKKVINLEFDEASSSNFSRHGDMVTLPWEHIEWMNQPFASKTISAAPFFHFSRVGDMTLYPNNDVWNDTEMLPDLIVDIDTGFDAIKAIADAAGVTGTVWTDVSSSEVVTGSSISQSIEGNNIVTTRTDQIQVTTDQSGVKTTLEEKITSNSLGTSVTDVQLLTYMRSIPVKIVVDKLPANMKCYFFFDGVDVTENVKALNQPSGQNLTTDENGVFTGIFTIPNTPVKRFYVGTKQLIITNSSTNSQDSDEIIGTAGADFHAGGLKQTKQETVISTAVPEIKKETLERTITTNTTRSTVTSRQLIMINGGGGGEPLAQSFLVQEEEGIFLSKIDLFFSARAEEEPVWFEVREMVNGYPGPNRMPYSRVTKKPNNINISDDGSVPTTFEFEAPVYLNGGVEYCFVFGTDDPANRCFISKLGKKDFINGSVISTQPHMGSLFKGQNNRTWNAEQTEDIKFKLYRAKFDYSQPMSIVSQATQENLLKKLPVNPFETETGLTSVRIHHRDHAFNAGDWIKLSMLSENEYTFTVNSGDLNVGMTLTSANGSGVIKQVTKVTNTEYKIILTDIEGYFANGETVTGLYVYDEVPQHILDKYNIDISNTGKLAVNGFFADGIDDTFNGIPLVDFTKEIQIDHVDSMDSYIITVDTAATHTGRIGGVVYTYSNAQIDAINIICNNIDWLGTAEYSFNGIKHKGIGSNITDYAVTNDNVISANKVVELAEPLKICSDLNKNKNNAGVDSFEITSMMYSNIDTLSPVINIGTYSLESFSNRVDWNTELNGSVAPNATTTGMFVLEDDNIMGSEKAKYISNVANLANPANLLNIFADVVDYADSEIVFYYRVLNAGDSTSIGDIDWVQLSYTKTSSETSTDFKEIEINIPTNNPLTPQDELPDFSAFQVKIVMRSKNSAKQPMVKRLRCMAMT